MGPTFCVGEQRQQTTQGALHAIVTNDSLKLSTHICREVPSINRHVSLNVLNVCNC